MEDVFSRSYKDLLFLVDANNDYKLCFSGVPPDYRAASLLRLWDTSVPPAVLHNKRHISH